VVPAGWQTRTVPGLVAFVAASSPPSRATLASAPRHERQTQLKTFADGLPGTQHKPLRKPKEDRPKTDPKQTPMPSETRAA